MSESSARTIEAVLTPEVLTEAIRAYHAVSALQPVYAHADALNAMRAVLLDAYRRATGEARLTELEIEELDEVLEHRNPVFRQRVIAAVKAVPPPARTCGTWEPIASAPKDGTQVILFGESFGRRYWFAAHWLHCDDGSSGWIGSSFWSQPEGNWTTIMGENVTHWMPLPVPPVAGLGEERPARASGRRSARSSASMRAPRPRRRRQDDERPR